MFYFGLSGIAQHECEIHQNADELDETYVLIVIFLQNFKVTTSKCALKFSFLTFLLNINYLWKDLVPEMDYR